MVVGVEAKAKEEEEEEEEESGFLGSPHQEKTRRWKREAGNLESSNLPSRTRQP